MIKLALLVFAIVIFVLLAGNWAIHSDQVRWSYAAFAAFFATFLPFKDIAVRTGTAPAPPA